MMSEDKARLQAFYLLDDIIQNKKYANLTLKYSLDGFDERDKAFITALVYGTLDKLITVDYVISMVLDKRTNELNELDDDCFCVSAKGRPIKAKTVGQQKYVGCIKNNTVTLGVGPAGTGKTFLAVAMATKALRSKEISRIILTRPAVEAGERLGFLPGDLQSKIDPYLRPLYDALYEMLGPENCTKYMEKMIIEIAPLAYMSRVL